MTPQTNVPICFFCLREIDSEAINGEYRIGGESCCTKCYKNEKIGKDIQRSNNFCKIAKTLTGEEAEQLMFVARLHKTTFNTDCSCG